jgi:hypothetical protein
MLTTALVIARSIDRLNSDRLDCQAMEAAASASGTGRDRAIADIAALRVEASERYLVMALFAADGLVDGGDYDRAWGCQDRPTPAQHDGRTYSVAYATDGLDGYDGQPRLVVT